MTTKKSKSKNEVKKKHTPKKLGNDEALQAALASMRSLGGYPHLATSTIDSRKELLARVAGSVAAGLVASPSPLLESAASTAAVAIDIADEILKKAGIPSTESSAETAAPTGTTGTTGNAGFGAVS